MQGSRGEKSFLHLSPIPSSLPTSLPSSLHHSFLHLPFLYPIHLYDKMRRDERTIFLYLMSSFPLTFLSYLATLSPRPHYLFLTRFFPSYSSLLFLSLPSFRSLPLRTLTSLLLRSASFIELPSIYFFPSLSSHHSFLFSSPAPALPTAIAIAIHQRLLA